MAVMILSFSGLCSGQYYQRFNSELEQIIERARWRLGPLRFYPMIRFVDVGYDSNVYRVREEDDPTTDFTFTFSPQLDTYLLFKNWMIFSLAVNPEYVFYASETSQRSWNQNFSPGIKMFIFQRFVLSGNYAYRKGKRRGTSEFDVRVDIETKSYLGSLYYEMTRRTTLGFSGSMREIKHEDVFEPDFTGRYSTLDRTEKEGVLHFYYSVFTDSIFFTNAGYTEYVFDRPESNWRDSYAYWIYSGIQFPILGRIRGTFSLGFKTLQPERSRKQGFTGFVGNTRLDYRAGRFGLRFSYVRDCQFSFWTNNVYFIEERIGPGVSFYVSQRIRLDYNVLLGDNYYPEPVTVRLPDETYQDINRDDDYLSHSVGLVFRVYRSIGIGLVGYYWKRDSNYPGVSRTWGFLGGYLTYEF
jgi:hypothetical protein